MLECSALQPAGFAAEAVQAPAAPRAKKRGWQEEELDGLETALKRVRLRPSIGQLRLRSELADWFDAEGARQERPERPGSRPDAAWWKLPCTPRAVNLHGWRAVCMTCDLERLTASFQVAGAAGAQLLLDFTFPPQYPHKPPVVLQRAPGPAVAQLPLSPETRQVQIEELDQLWRLVHSIDHVLTCIVKRLSS